MQNVNTALFELINAPASPPEALLWFARLLANWMIYLAAGAMVWVWVRGDGASRKRLFSIGFTAAIALLANFAIAANWYHPRPFEIGIGHQFLPHAAETSFPSDHATVLFALAFGLLFAGASKFWATSAFCAAVGVAWARVYLGIHWPLDMAGSFLVALVSAWGASRAMRMSLLSNLSAGLVKTYDWFLDALGVPASLSPKASGKDESSRQ